MRVHLPERSYCPGMICFRQECIPQYGDRDASGLTGRVSLYIQINPLGQVRILCVYPSLEEFAQRIAPESASHR